MKRFGTEYGGFYYPENLDGLDESSIIYCIGAGEDISHDIEIAHKLNSNVYIIDPTPRAIEHYEYVKNVLEGKDKIIYDNKFGGNNPYIYWKIILENKIDTNKIIYKNYGVGINEGIQKFYLPSNETYVSCSLVEGMKSSKYIDVNVKKLKSIMNELGHTRIDLLKMDIEGSECDVIENMLEDKIYPKYLAVEFDNILKKETTKNLLETNGYILLYQDNNNYVYKYNINVCIIHIGYKKYVEENIKITSKTNKIYLIGDNSVKCLEKYKNVEYVDIEEFMKNEKINFYKNNFKNYSSNSFDFEWFCMCRIFIIKLFLNKYNLNHIFHLDSDCILLKNINNYPFKEDIAYCINQNYDNKYRMSNSIHSGLLNNKFCIEFEKLYNDLYVNKTKMYLLEDKINYHKNNAGGICDMTLYYLLQNENYIKVDNLLKIKNYRNTKLTFMNTLYSNESSTNKDRYLKENNIIKLYDINEKKYVYDKINQEYIELWNIHYQGDCKKLLENNYELNDKNILLEKSIFKNIILEQIKNKEKYIKENDIYKIKDSIICIIIKNNEIVDIKESNGFIHKGRKNQYIELIKNVCKKYNLLDCNININLNDFPKEGVFNFCRRKNNINEFLFPTFRFIENDIKIDKNHIIKNLKTYKETSLYLQNYHKEYLFENKINKIYTSVIPHISKINYFIYALNNDFCTGWINCGTVHKYCDLENYKDLISHLKNKKLLGYEGQYFIEHIKYKYILYNDGNTLSDRMNLLLNINSVIIKKKSLYEEFFWYLLKNNVNYIEYINEEELKDIYIYLENNTNICKNIINNNNNFVNNILTYENILEYVYLLLSFII